MKAFIASLVSIVCLAAASLASAAVPERETIALEVPAGLAQEVCAQPVWSGVTAVWRGVTDARPEKAVGLQTRSKGKDPIEVYASPTLASVLDKALREIFTACGMKLVLTPGGETLRLGVEIRQFYAGVEKKLLTGKAKATSSLMFVADKGVRTTTIDIGNDIESKEARKGDIKGLTKALNTLLAETLKQVPATQQLRELK